jgi:hypothetical protein
MIVIFVKVEEQEEGGEEGQKENVNKRIPSQFDVTSTSSGYNVRGWRVVLTMIYLLSLSAWILCRCLVLL